MIDRKRPDGGPTPREEPDDGSRPYRMLVVGPRTDLDVGRKTGDAERNLFFVVFEELTPDVIVEIAPDIVVSNLIEADFDATDVAKRLSAANYLGKYRAISVGIANPTVIAKEIKTVAPTLNFEVFQLDAGSP